MRLGNDVLEVSSDGQLVINGSRLRTLDGEMAMPAMMFAGHEIKKHIAGTQKKIINYDLDLGGTKSIQIRVNIKTKMLFVDLKGVYNDSTGLLGSSAEEALLSRDGSKDLSGEWNALGEEWQVNSSDQKLFLDDRAPQYPNGCVYEVEKERNLRRRRLTDESAEGVTIEVAQSACANMKGHNKDFCIGDVMATGDLELAKDPFYN